MFFLSLALLGQSAGLDTDIGKAARKCVGSYIAAMPKPDDAHKLELLSEVLYLSMSASRAEGRTGGTFLSHAMDVINEAKAQMAKDGITPALAADCDKRFPLARGMGQIQLPQAQADRDILCASSISLLGNMASGMTDVARDLQALQNRFDKGYGVAMRSKANGPEQEEQVVGDTMRASLDIGNVESIAFSCSKLPA
jgi:hypothetical protein